MQFVSFAFKVNLHTYLHVRVQKAVYHPRKSGFSPQPLASYTELYSLHFVLRVPWMWVLATTEAPSPSLPPSA